MPRDADVIVVGAGAAGLLCAATSARRGRRTLLLERMERPGRKLMITGKGRCNLTNNCDRDRFMASVGANSRFLYGAWNSLSAKDTMELFEELGVPLKTERGDRVFPVSERAADIVDALSRYARGGGAELLRGRAASLLVENGAVTGVGLEEGGTLAAQSVVVATGGMSYPATGSTGDGYRLAMQAGHTVTALRASLVSIVTRETWCRDAMGLSLRNAELTLTRAGSDKPLFRERGELLFTHFGVSGPLVLSASSYVDGNPADYKLSIDLKPALSHRKLDERLLRDFGENPNRDFQNILPGLLPRGLIGPVLRLSGIEAGSKVHQITKEQRRSLGTLLKALILHVDSLRPIEEAVVTRGGVSVREVNPATMGSKLAGGLYFAGEVLDLDARTGGFNLQIAFSTGHLAGRNA